MKPLESLLGRAKLLRYKPGPSKEELRKLSSLKARYRRRARIRFGKLFREAYKYLPQLKLYKFGEKRYIQLEGPGYQINILLNDFSHWTREGAWITTNVVSERRLQESQDWEDSNITGFRSLVKWIKAVKARLGASDASEICGSAPHGRSS